MLEQYGEIPLPILNSRKYSAGVVIENVGIVIGVGKSLGIRPWDFLWTLAIFHCISLLSSQYRFKQPSYQYAVQQLNPE